MASLWTAPGRPAWWTGEPRWTPPQDPAAKVQALAGARDLPDDLKAGIRAWFMERREQYLAARRTEAEARMRSYLPDPAGGDGPQSTAAQPGRLPTK